MPTETAIGRVHELGHVVLYVRDIERSLTFYRDLLGWAVRPMPNYPRGVAGFRAGDTHHDLLLLEVGEDAAPLPSGPRVGMYHFGVKVGHTDAELKDVVDRVRSRPDLGRVQGLVDAGYIHSAYISDPDGNEIEAYVDIPGADWDDPDLFNMRTAVRRALEL